MKKIFLFVAALCCSAAMWAADFSAVVASGQTLYFDITDNENLKCEVTSGDGSYTSTISGDVTIPAEVVNPNDTKTYTVVGIGNRAFQDCSSITSLTFPTAATFDHIGNSGNAFSLMNCVGIKSLTIPDNVTFLGEQAFRGMGITDVTFGTGITTIPNSLFFDCHSLKRVVFPNHITGIEEGVFSGSAVKYVELGNAIENGLDAHAFGYDSYWWAKSSIDTIVINTTTPPALTNSFYSELANRCILYVPVGSKALYKEATGWKDLRYILEKGEVLATYNITVSGGYSSLEQVSFKLDGENCAKNFSFKRAEGETFTIQATFGNPYYGIKKVMYGETDVTAEFDSENKATLTVTADATLTFTYEQKSHPYDFTEEVASGQTLYFKILDAVNHTVAICNQTGGRSLWGVIDDAYDGNVTSPSGALVIPTAITHEAVEYIIEEIDTLAFNECSLTSVTIPEGIKAIRAGAFHYTYSGSIGAGMELVIPQSCTRLEVRAFQNCSYTSVNPGGAQVIEEYALRCPLTEVKATSALEELHMDAFQSSALTKVGLGENVEFVSNEAFSSCPNLATVTCLATTPPDVRYEIGSINAATSWGGGFDPASATLYVPKSEGHTVLEAYKAANCWKLFGTIAEIPDTPTALDNTNANTKAIKRIVNGQLFIERDGKTFNAQGIEVR